MTFVTKQPKRGGNPSVKREAAEEPRDGAGHHNPARQPRLPWPPQSRSSNTSFIQDAPRSSTAKAYVPSMHVVTARCLLQLRPGGCRIAGRLSRLVLDGKKLVRWGPSSRRLGVSSQMALPIAPALIQGASRGIGLEFVSLCSRRAGSDHGAGRRPQLCFSSPRIEFPGDCERYCFRYTTPRQPLATSQERVR